MEPGPTGRVGPSVPRRVAVELKPVKDLAPTLHQKETDRVVWER